MKKSLTYLNFFVFFDVFLFFSTNRFLQFNVLIINNAATEWKVLSNINLLTRCYSRSHHSFPHHHCLPQYGAFSFSANLFIMSNQGTYKNRTSAIFINLVVLFSRARNVWFTLNYGIQENKYVYIYIEETILQLHAGFGSIVKQILI